MNPNATVKIIAADRRPYLGVFALRDIPVGEEILYDYGVKSSKVIEIFDWLKK